MSYSPSPNFVKALKELEHVICVSHVNPDADAYGSIASAGLMFAALGKRVSLVNADGLIDRYQFIPGLDEVETQISPLVTEGSGLFICDCGDLKRVGDDLRREVEALAIPTFNVDHHQSNPLFADFNFVESSASSTCELIYSLASALGAQVERDMASALYVGIIGDTGCFRYRSASEETFRVALELISTGIDPASLASSLFGRVPERAIRLQSAALQTLELHCDGKLAFVSVSAELMQQYEASPDDTEELVEKIRDIEGVVASVFVREEADFLKGSLRSKSEAIDVAALAGKFGGGGHRAAAGFRTKKSLSALKQDLLNEFESIFQ